MFKLMKALYGFEQVARAWNEKLRNFLLENGFERGKVPYSKRSEIKILSLSKFIQLFLVVLINPSTKIFLS